MQKSGNYIFLVLHPAFSAEGSFLALHLWCPRYPRKRELCQLEHHYGRVNT